MEVSMKNILVVDDECPIREWIMFCIKNQFKDTYSVELAPNGKEAFSMFMKKKYDLVITDIKMPVMDGLTLSQNIHDLSPKTGIIFLSSYNNFEYVHSALKLHAFDYLLKTEITEIRVKEIIDKFFSTIETTLKNPEIPSHSFKKILNDSDYNNELFKSFLEKNNILMPKQIFFCFAAKLHSNNLKEHLFIPHKEQLALSFSVQYDDDIYLGCIEINSVPSLLLQTELQSAFINDIAEKNPLSMLSVTPICAKKDNLLTLIKIVLKNLNLSFYGKSVVYTSANPSNDRSIIDKHYLDILELIKLKQRESLEKKLYDFFSLIETQLFTDIEFIKNTCFKICEAICIQYYGNDHCNFSTKTTEIMGDISRINLFNNLREYILQQCLTLLEQLPLYLNNYSPQVKKAILHIKQNYGSIQGLNEVADMVFLNPEYFSRLFKKETGLNFSTFLNDYRLKQSIEFMKNTDLKLYEIAEKVGFSSLAYYSKKFKEMYGMTPFEYKGNYLSL